MVYGWLPVDGNTSLMPVMSMTLNISISYRTDAISFPKNSRGRPAVSPLRHEVVGACVGTIDGWVVGDTVVEGEADPVGISVSRP